MSTGTYWKQVEDELENRKDWGYDVVRKTTEMSQAPYVGRN